MTALIHELTRNKVSYFQCEQHIYIYRSVTPDEAFRFVVVGSVKQSYVLDGSFVQSY